MTDREILDDDDPTPGIQLDAHGDPLPQGTRMIEYESYERVIEGLKIAADAQMHLTYHEPTEKGVAASLGLVWYLDQYRRESMEIAGTNEMRFEPTKELRGPPMSRKEARRRRWDGLQQAHGGMTQIGVSQRKDVRWVKLARAIDAFMQNIRNPKRSLHFRREGSRVDGYAGPQLLLPPGYVRH